MQPPISFLFFYLFLPLTLSSFLPSNLRGLYVRRIGSSNCPRLIEISSTELSLSPNDITLNNAKPCTQGALTLQQSPSTGLSSSGLLARYLSGTYQAGNFILATITERLLCPERHFEQDSGFTFISANETFEVSWSAIFENANTGLANQSETGDKFTFERNAQYMIVNDQCFYNRIDIPPESTRACFPANALVMLQSGAQIEMRWLKVGDVVQTSADRYSRVVMFSHRNDRYGYVSELRVGNQTLKASKGHLLEVFGEGLLRIGDVKMGMRVRLGEGGWGVVEGVGRGIEWGVYNPHTEMGEIVVGGVVCSCYTEVIGVGVAHALLAPVRGLWLGGLWEKVGLNGFVV